MKRIAALLLSLVLLLSATTLLAEPPPETLTIGMKNDAVLRVQVRLKELGYYFAALDSGFGPATLKAVSSFQSNNALTVTGKVDVLTYARMFAHDAVKGSFTPPVTPVLRPGDKGTEVTQAQVRLKELKYYQGPVDGSYGYGTYAAVRAFQQRHNLPVDGKIGPVTRAELYNAGAIMNGVSVITTDMTVLSYGSQSPAVIQAQTRLKELGYYTGSLDGKFRALTARAVSAFQKNNGLKVDGKVGSATWAKLNMAGAVPATPPPPVASGLQEGDSGPAVTRAQQVLKALGFYHGPINGQYTIYITQAVTAFQQKYGLPANGIIDAATSARLNTVYQPPDPNKVAPPAMELKLGMEGDSVVKAQTRLKELLYYRGAIDGKYGSGTQAAVSKFQARTSIPVTGRLDLLTATQLYAVTALTNPDALIPPKTTLRLGSTGPAVTQAQARLAALGYYTGTVDGVYGLSTYNAVVHFQGLTGLGLSGEIDDVTESALYAATAVHAPSGPDPKAKPNVLRRGAEGPEVSLAQARLKALGYLAGAVDGKYGWGTYYAVAAFQEVVGLPKDGKIGDSTRSRLYANDAPVKPDHIVVIPPSTGFAVLRPGDKGPRVADIQNRLAALNYYTGAIDGVYGSGTTVAVSEFQAKNTLIIDGKVGEQTFNKLFSPTAIPK